LRSGGSSSWAGWAVTDILKPLQTRLSDSDSGTLKAGYADADKAE